MIFNLFETFKKTKAIDSAFDKKFSFADIYIMQDYVDNHQPEPKITLLEFIGLMSKDDVTLSWLHGASKKLEDKIKSDLK